MITLEFTFDINGTADYFKYYRSLTPIDINNPPLPTETNILTQSYIDNTAANDAIYYIRFSSVKFNIEKFSDEIIIDTGVPRDQYIANVVVLSSFDNTMINEISGLNWIGGTLSSDKSKFGTHSLSFNGSQQCSITDNRLKVLNNEYTFEFWINSATVYGSTRYFVSTGINGSDWYTIGIDTSMRLVNWFGGSQVASTYTIIENTWNHIVIQRRIINSIKYHEVYCNGTLILQRHDNNGSNYDYIYIGSTVSSIASTWLIGYIDEVRFTENIARYQGSYTVPEYKFPRI